MIVMAVFFSSEKCRNVAPQESRTKTTPLPSSGPLRYPLRHHCWAASAVSSLVVLPLVIVGLRAQREDQEGKLKMAHISVPK